MMNDISRAYFFAKATRDIFIELPPEDPEYGKSDFIGQLRLCFYGTREAVLNWQETLSQHLVESGLTRGVGFPSVFYHREWDIWTLVHGDDYFSTGSVESLAWLEQTLAKKYEIKTQKVGHSPGCKVEGQILNRVIRATSEGFEVEADPRHAELILEQLQLEQGKGLSAPGNDDHDETTEEAEEILLGEEATAFRGMAARCNYLAADRPDIMFSVK